MDLVLVTKDSLSTFENCKVFYRMSLGDLSSIFLITGLGLVTRLGRHQKLKCCHTVAKPSMFIAVAVSLYRQNGVFTKHPMVGHLHFLLPMFLSEHQM